MAGAAVAVGTVAGSVVGDTAGSTGSVGVSEMVGSAVGVAVDMTATDTGVAAGAAVGLRCEPLFPAEAMATSAGGATMSAVTAALSQKRRHDWPSGCSIVLADGNRAALVCPSVRRARHAEGREGLLIVSP